MSDERTTEERGAEPRRRGEERDAERGSGTSEQGSESSERGSGRTAGGERQARRWGEAFSEVGDAVGDVVDEVIEGVRGVTSGRRFPRMDLVRVEGGYRLYVDVPGLRRDQVQVTTLGGQLTIRGERRRPELPEGAEVIRSERGFGRFERTMRMPPDVREEGVAASLDDGVLILELPGIDESEAHEVEIG